MREETGGKLCSFCQRVRAEHTLYCTSCSRIEYACDLCYSEMEDEHTPDINFIDDSKLEDLR